MKRFLIILLLSIINAEISNDSLATLVSQGKIEILEEVKYIDPLEGKIFGVEINPIYTMIYDADGFSCSGTFSLFPKNQNAEIAFPFSYKSLPLFDSEFPFLNIDAQYRYFLGKHRKGTYIMTGLRFSGFKDRQDQFEESSYNKQGVSFGIGWRIFGRSGWYWGCSFYMGKYYFGSDNGSDGFMNLEFLKFGKTF